MKKTILICLLVVCVSISDAQIKTQHEYDYVGTESNNAGLRVVGKRTKIVGAQKDKWGRWQKYDQELNLYGCINKDGYEIVPLKYKEVTISKGTNYIIVVTPAQVDADNYAVPEATGLLSEDGSRTIINPYYKHILMEPTIFKTLKCAIFVSQKDHYGIVNNRAEEIVSPIYESLYWLDTENGYLAAMLNGFWGIIDYKGNEIVTHEYKMMMHGHNGFVLAKDKDERSVLMRTNGNIVIPLGKYILSDYNGWVLWAQDGDKYALFNSNGEIVLPFKNYGKLQPENAENYEYIHDNVMRLTYSHNRKAKIKFFDDLGREHKHIESAKAANRVIRESKKNINNRLAILTWLNITENVQQQEYKLQIDVKSDSKIEDVIITINNTRDRGIKTVNSSDYDLTINRTLTLNEGTNVIKVCVRNAAGTTQEEKTIVYRPQGGELPTIEWLDFAATANKKEYQMKLGIKSKSKVEEVNVTLNGNLSRGIKTVQADGNDLTIDRTLALSEGVNRIVVSVRNGDGISTSEKVITYQGINPTPVFNDKRIAFVVGNSHYSRSEMNLTNPENDAKDVAEKLKNLGFEVVLKLDATLETMDKELSSFKEKAKDYDVAMFYYAGHGIQSKGVNYIIPTNIDNLAEDNMKYKCVDMERVLDVMEDSHCKLKIVILDACRNDPLSRRWHRSAGTRGLSIMSAPTGTIISYSTAPGKTALDGEGRNSPYTEAFLYSLDMPNLDVFHFFQKVGAEVKRKTKDSQDPWWSSSFTGDFYFNKQ